MSMRFLITYSGSVNYKAYIDDMFDDTDNFNETTFLNEILISDIIRKTLNMLLVQQDLNGKPVKNIFFLVHEIINNANKYESYEEFRDNALEQGWTITELRKIIDFLYKTSNVASVMNNAVDESGDSIYTQEQIADIIELLSGIPNIAEWYDKVHWIYYGPIIDVLSNTLNIPIVNDDNSGNLSSLIVTMFHHNTGNYDEFKEQAFNDGHYLAHFESIIYLLNYPNYIADIARENDVSNDVINQILDILNNLPEYIPIWFEEIFKKSPEDDDEPEFRSEPEPEAGSESEDVVVDDDDDENENNTSDDDNDIIPLPPFTNPNESQNQNRSFEGKFNLGQDVDEIVLREPLYIYQVIKVFQIYPRIVSGY